jgi:hypothetical protein
LVAQVYIENEALNYSLSSFMNQGAGDKKRCEDSIQGQRNYQKKKKKKKRCVEGSYKTKNPFVKRNATFLDRTN